jgi:dihydrodipicolinate synthase/N-acetylneuraminate lyase
MAKTKLSPKGIVVSLNTPFDDVGGIDFESLDPSIDRHLKADSAEFLSPQAAEVGALSLDDRQELVAQVRSSIADARSVRLQNLDCEQI